MKKISKKYLELLFKAVRGYKTPKMVLGRVRDGFLRDLIPLVDQFQKDRTEIYVKFCDKKEDGTPDIVDNKYKFAPSVLDEINKELTILGEEAVDIIIPPETKNMIEESSYETESGETTIIDEIIAIC